MLHPPVFVTESLRCVLSVSGEYVQSGHLRPGGGDLTEAGGEGVEGGERGAEIGADGRLDLGQEVRELGTQPVHLLFSL